MKNVHLVLGSSGARGMAHIGVTEVFENGDFNLKRRQNCFRKEPEFLGV